MTGATPKRTSILSRRLSACMAGLFVVLSLAACGGGNETPTNATATAGAVAATSGATSTGAVAATSGATSTGAAQITPSEQGVAQATGTPVAPEATNTEAQGASTAGTTAVAGGKTYTNPVLRADFPDPFVLLDNGTYYAYATNGSGKNIQLARSTDLVTWEVLSDAMPATPKWAKFGGSLIWAPEVMKIGSTYVMYYVARDKASDRQCVGVATANSPEGKFADKSDKALVCQSDLGGTIDPDPFRDGDKLYLYYKNDGNCCGMHTDLWAQELSPDGLSLVGEPSKLIENTEPWEGSVVEAPTMWKHDDKYYLFFSANNYAGFEYAVGYATCDTPTGPCQQAQENPILSSRMNKQPLVVGPGHQCLVQVGDQTWIVYHVWNVNSNGMRGSNRYMYIDRLDWKNGKPVVEGPTTDPQPAP